MVKEHLPLHKEVHSQVKELKGTTYIMVKFGWKAVSEQFPPNELLEQAIVAEQAGFEFIDISDHFHPWSEAGQAPSRAAGPPRVPQSELGGLGEGFAKRLGTDTRGG